MLRFPIYLDNNSTTPCDPRVVEAMLPYFSTEFGNAASRSHAFGWHAEEAVDMAREQLASLIRAEANEIIFTSGATESVNLALKSVFDLYANKGCHIITSNIEHKAVIDTCNHLEKSGAEITRLPVDSQGLISPEAIESAIQPNTRLIAIMFANNEIGTLQPVKAIGAIAKRRGIIFFSDATQAIGKIPVDVNNEDIDLMAFSAHKMYGPKGTGALFVRRRNPRIRIGAQIHGGGHERGMRSGTLNVPGIVGFGKAAEICANEMDSDISHTRRLRDKLESALLERTSVQVNGSRDYRLPHVSNLSFQNVQEGLLGALTKSIAVSSGSACTSATLEPSYVLKAIGLEDRLAYHSIRFGTGRFTTPEEIDYTIEFVSQTVKMIESSGYKTQESKMELL